jgi:hypothetical protein
MVMTEYIEPTVNVRTDDFPSFYSFADVEQPDPYRGFPIRRERPYFHYKVADKKGYIVAPELSSWFTGLKPLKAAIDRWLTANPHLRAIDAYKPVIVGRGPGRPRGSKNKPKASKETTSTNNLNNLPYVTPNE